MFERPHHQRIATWLGCLDANLLRECRCLFGGGTAVALRFGEYREALDVDFLVSDPEGYRRLRGVPVLPARAQPGVAALASPARAGF